MERILSSIVNEYDKLLRSYEKVYESFRDADSAGVDKYIETIDKSSEHIISISDTQKKIQELRDKLKSSIHSDFLIDTVIDGYSDGRVESISERINLIIGYLKSFESKSMAVLKQEMEKVQDNLGVDADYIKEVAKEYAVQNNEDKGLHIDRHL